MRGSALFVGNYFSVHRVRPQDDDASEDGNSDDIVSDEELQVSSEQLLDALATRIGGRERKQAADEQEACAGGASHYQNSCTAMDLDERAEQRKAPEFVAPKDPPP